MSEVIEIEPTTPAKAPSTALTPMEMLGRAVDNGSDVETLGKLMDLHERWQSNEARKAFDAAMADLRADLPDIVKSSEVDFTNKNGQRTNYKYEDLSAVTKALSPIMAQHGLSFRWRTHQQDGGVVVTCIITHRDGHYEETALQAAPDNSAGKNGIQSIGSTVTYLQRYTLKAAVGVAASHDDDGQSYASSNQEPDFPGDRPAPLSKAKSRGLYTELQQDIDSADSVQALEVWFAQRAEDVNSLQPDWLNELRSRYANKLHDLKHGGSHVE